MSIWTGRPGYDPIKEFSERTTRELADPNGVLFKRDTEPPADEVEWIRERLRGHKSVLELGCGLGIWAKVAAEVGCNYVGVDPVAERIAYAREHFPTGWFVHDDARTVRMPRNFSAVLTVTCIQHLPLNDAIDVLHTAAHHLQPDGHIIMMESRIRGVSEEECERMYARPEYSAHMIPKPMSVLMDAVPHMRWTFGDKEDRFVLVPA